MSKKTQQFDPLAGANELDVATVGAATVVVMGEYDYSQLGDAALARWAEGQEAAIKRELASMDEHLQIVETHQGRAVDRALTVGKQLGEAKEKLPHGQFQPWVDAAFKGAYGLSYRTAVRWMGVAEKFGHRPELVGQVGIKVAGLLASRIDEGEADGILDEVERHLQEHGEISPTAAKAIKDEVLGYVDVARLERVVQDWLVQFHATKKRQLLVLLADRLTTPDGQELMAHIKVNYRKRDLVSAIKNLLEQARQQEREAAKPQIRSDDDWADALEVYITTVLYKPGLSTLKQRYDAAVFMNRQGAKEQQDAFVAAHDWIVTHYRIGQHSYGGYWWEMEKGRHILIKQLLNWLIERAEGVQVEMLEVVDDELYEVAKVTYSADKLQSGGHKGEPKLRGVFEHDGRLWVCTGCGPDWCRCQRVHPDGEPIEPGMPPVDVRAVYLGLCASCRGKWYTFGSQYLNIKKTPVEAPQAPASPNTRTWSGAAQGGGTASGWQAVEHRAETAYEHEDAYGAETDFETEAETTSPAEDMRRMREWAVGILEENGGFVVAVEVRRVLDKAVAWLEGDFEHE